MGIMVCGAETTAEEQFIYSEDVQKMIRKALKELNDPESKRTKQGVLETLVWQAVLKFEE